MLAMDKFTDPGVSYEKYTTCFVAFPAFTFAFDFGFVFGFGFGFALIRFVQLSPDFEVRFFVVCPEV